MGLKESTKHIMFPIGAFLGGDKQKQVAEAFKTSPDKANDVKSLFEQVAGLTKGFSVDLLPAFFNFKRMFIKADIAVVVDSPAQATVCGLGEW
jgi:hypothetical protein